MAGTLAVALIVGGCGSSSDDGEVTESSITKAEFVKQAEAACEKGEKQVETSFNTYLKENKDALEQEATKAQFADVLETVLVPAIEQEIEDIREIGSPSGEVDQIQAIIDALEEGLEKSQADPRVGVQETVVFFDDAYKLARRNTASRSAAKGNPGCTANRSLCSALDGPDPLAVRAAVPRRGPRPGSKRTIRVRSRRPGWRR